MDSDNDGFLDIVEIALGTGPYDPFSPGFEAPLGSWHLAPVMILLGVWKLYRSRRGSRNRVGINRSP